MTEFYSNGKLLLTAEYVVLDGAKALALPTKYGQNLTVKSIEEKKLFWNSIGHYNRVWFESELSTKALANSFNKDENPVLKRLFEILISAKQLNPDFLNPKNGYEITTKLDFPKNWGLGSSSTLINNIANWAEVDAFKLLELTFGGSGYDIACAQNNTPIVYHIDSSTREKTVTPVTFNPSFKNQLFFVHLNKKQNSREGIKHYKLNNGDVPQAIDEINTITETIINTSSITEFESLITKHEQIISKLIDLPTVKLSLFPDYSGSIKSLGAWGGDFILVTGSTDTMDYFKQKGYNTIIPYHKMIL